MTPTIWGIREHQNGALRHTDDNHEETEISINNKISTVDANQYRIEINIVTIPGSVGIMSTAASSPKDSGFPCRT